MTSTPADPGQTPDEPERIDGHTLDELADYLDAGRSPADPSIESSAECRLYLDALARLRNRSWDALREEAGSRQGRDDTWINGLLRSIRDEIRTGRDIPIDDPDPSIRLSISEAAVHGLIRATADTVEGIILARTQLEGDVSTRGAAITVAITAAVEYGRDLQRTADALRERVRTVLAEHTELTVALITVTIDDLYVTQERSV
ncbi:hypothetical protein HQQ80_19780 [Microbacteriaceae bacterium VKM Ac-2855]|nr:hypothetical protein [Microbacteriaceae bacterium VKM Ac-2855]